MALAEQGEGCPERGVPDVAHRAAVLHSDGDELAQTADQDNRHLPRYRADSGGAQFPGVGEVLEQDDERVLQVPLQPARLDAQGGRVADPAQGEGGPGIRGLDPRRDRLPDLGLRRGLAVHRTGDAPDDVRVGVGQQRDEARFLVGEVLVEGPPGGPGAADDIRDRGGAVAVLRDRLRERVEQPLPVRVRRGRGR
ncbi:MAG TPA: hypothetical protein VG142_09010 [Trebonia sp.]|nr:hypothetical protein [Trebonia sp.]